MAKVFLKNTGKYNLSYAAILVVEGTDEAGKKYNQRKEKFRKEFLPFKKDSTTGKVVSTGFTQIDESEYEELLTTSKMFADAVKNKNLQMFRDAPKEALLDSQLLDNYSEENTALKARVAELEEIIEQGASKAAKAQIEKLKAEIADLRGEELAESSDDGEL